jgi:peptide/nickel transport system permease protein
MSLLSYVIRRLLQAIPLIILTMVLTFCIIQLAPGDPVSYMMSGAEFAPPGFIEAKRAELGLDQPLPVRLLIYLKNVFTGNFGYSYIQNAPVVDIIYSKIGNTLLLTVTGFLIQVIGGTLLGVVAAWRRNSAIDATVSVTSLFLWSMPYFWMAILSIVIFSFYLHIFPIGGMSTPGVTGFQLYLDTAWHLVLPASVLGLGALGLYSRMTRSSMLEVMHQDYMLTAWAKGLGERAVLLKHALRNALLPLVTLIGLGMGNLFMGAVLVEIVFRWPGMGTLIFDSIISRDYAMVQIVFLILAIIVVLANLAADIAYAVVDPRIRYR